MKIQVTYYGESTVGRVRVANEKDEMVAYIHFGPFDSFQTEAEATEAASAIIATYNKIEHENQVTPTA